tara:strand:+ start:86393 stop:87469 length:1077 start_codon:yes stop_codon:yes gene_type:complete
MSQTFQEIHPRFKLNGIAFSLDDLKEVGYCLIKEGDAFEIAIGNFLIDWADDSDSIEVSTSGSTGAPKKIKLQKVHMVNSAKATGSFFSLLPGNSALLCLPTDFIAGKMMLVRAMVLGLELDYVVPNSIPLENTDKDYDFSAMIPLQLQNSLDKMNQVKTLIVGGAQLSVDLTQKVQDKQTAVFETYGMTETITHIAAKKVNHKKSSESNFQTLPDIAVSTDNRSCLVIDAPNISHELVVTNDVVHLISDSEFEWLGRYDGIINSGGIKLIPEKIEAKLASIITNQFFVAGTPDEILGQKMILIIETSSEHPNLLQKIKELSALEKFEIPKAIFYLEKFIMTENGKIQRSKTIALALK